MGLDFSVHSDMPLVKQKAQLNDNLSLSFFYANNGVPLYPNCRGGLDCINDEYLNAFPNHPSLPDISHTKGTKYLSLDKNGNFKQLRIYDYSGRPVIDIDYGAHIGLSKQPALHVHTWKGGRDSGVRLFSKRDYKKYGKYLKGLIKNEWIK